MLREALFDLGDTLRVSPMDEFLPACFRALTGHFDGLIPARRLMGPLMRTTEVMDANCSSCDCRASARHPGWLR